jgi:hypothetical protein
LISFNIHEAAPIFIDQLAEEEIPSNLEKLIDGLVSWKQTDTLPVLRELLQAIGFVITKLFKQQFHMGS